MWTTFRAFPASFLPTLRLVGAVAVLSAGVAACSGSPTGPTPAPGPGGGTTPPPARTETRYDVGVTVRYIDISRSQACDGRVPIVGTVLDGEFHYKIEAIGPLKGELLATSNYGNVGGDAVQRGANERIDFTNRTWSFNDLKDGEDVRMRFRGIEWDGPLKDPDLNDALASKDWAMTASLTSQTGLELSIGNNSCGMTLVYNLSVARREVPM